MMLTREKIREVVKRVAPKYEIDSIYLFGSYARGDATEESDCDFRVEGGNMSGLFELGGLYADLEDALGKPIDLVMTDSMRESFYELIKDEEVLVYAKV